MSIPVLLIDDDKYYLELLTRILSKEGYEVASARDVETAMRIIRKQLIPVVMTDVNLPDGDGLELIKMIKSKSPYTEVIVITGYGTISDGVIAIKSGAFDYIVKGDDHKKILPLINKAKEKFQMQTRINQLETKITDKFSFDNIIGSSKIIVDAKKLALKVAQRDTTVLLLGETGTGKEVFAQAIHYAGHRKLKPFVGVNCSTIGKDILESELFGHKAGAFTGAVKDKQGLMEEASGGTIFLDEVGEMNIELQAKLLRVLETRQFYKVGDSKPTCVDVRVIAATNRDLNKEIEHDKFRSDLFYRLSVFQITLPSLHERVDDLEMLTNHFIDEFTDKMVIQYPKVSKDFIKVLKKHQWKGNIRELKNVIERAMILSDGELRPEFLPFDFMNDSSTSTSLVLADVEKLHIRKVLRHTNGNKAETARMLHIGLNTLYRKIAIYKIK